MKNKFEEIWIIKYNIASAYYEHNGNLEIPVKFKTLNGYEYDENGTNLGIWINHQRQSYKKAKLSPEKINLLKTIGMRFKTGNYNDWNENYALAQDYYEHNGNLEIPASFKTLNGYEYDENGISLGTWIQNQRQSYKKAKLSPEKINLLKTIGMRLETGNYNDWNENYVLAQDYYEHNGNLEIPASFKTLNGYEYDENGINLGKWIDHQRQSYKKAKLSPERINLLESIGMKWFVYNNINYKDQNVIFDNNTQRLIKLKILNSFKSYLNSLDQNTLPSKEEINQDFLGVLNYTHKKK